ncbi:MAG: twin-arginine translocation signal domain-containing protein [Burkholderiales bacterium]|nr:twin-arginine translocation signal domain-containing protein [Burkholderiales bacterium]
MEKNISRRDFFQKSALATAGAIVARLGKYTTG